MIQIQPIISMKMFLNHRDGFHSKEKRWIERTTFVSNFNLNALYHIKLKQSILSLDSDGGNFPTDPFGFGNLFGAMDSMFKEMEREFSDMGEHFGNLFTYRSTMPKVRLTSSSCKIYQ